jgi:hypothetical protein
MDEADAGPAMIDQVGAIQGQQGGIRQRNYRAAKLYGGHGFISAGRFSSSMGQSWGVNNGGYFGSYTSPRYNLIYSMVNTVLARLIAPGLPGVRILTNEAEWELQERAQLLERWIEGIFYQCDTEEQAIMALKDALVFGNGFIKASTDADGRIVNERMFPESVWTEMFDGKDGRPRTIYQNDLMDRDVLIAKFPNAEEEILKAQTFETKGYDSVRSGSRSVAFYEAWHLPSSEKRGDGVNIFAIEGKVLRMREWKRKKAPIAQIKFDDLLTGYLGRGMAELLYPHQAALSAIQRAEYYAWSQVALPRLWINIRSKINEIHMMSSRSSGIMRGIGDPPQVLNWSATHPDFVGYKGWVITSAHEFMGISQMSASGMKPPGLNSGAAQREYMDIQVERFAVLAHKWEKLWVDIANCDIDEANDSYDSESEDGQENLAVRAQDGFTKQIKWSQARMDRDVFWLKAYPVSSLPHSPAGRLAMVSELMQANLITREEGLKLLRFPDLDETLAMENAMQDYADKNAWLILRKGQMPPYDSIVNLQLAVTTLQKMATKAMNGGLSRDSKPIQNARQWLLGAKAQLQAAMPPPPSVQPALGPQAKPVAPPVNTELPMQAAA